MSEKEQTSEKLKKLECPFTWGLEEIDEIVKKHDESKTHDDENLVPILKLMRLIVATYESVLKQNFTKAQESLKLAKEILEAIKQDKDKEQISLKVLENIFNGTKCHLEGKLNNSENVDEILNSIHKIDYETDAKARSTLNGCKALAWSKYKESGKRGTGKAVDFAKLAIKDTPDFSGWHFILGKNLRRQRRGPQMCSTPWPEEMQAFQTAYKLNPEDIYGVYIAVIYKEQKKYSEALEMYKKIYNTNPKSSTIKLRLALGFIRARESSLLPLAKECLDFVEERSPEDCMYLHYRGLYLEAYKKFGEAAQYYLRACKDDNYGAEMSFLRCKSKQRANYDFIGHLQKLLKKYEKLDEHIELDLLLHIAGTYFFRKKDFESAAKYYLKAFEKDPTSKLFKNHIFILSSGSTDIFSLLKDKFIPQANRKKDLDYNTKQTLLKLKEFCNKNEPDFVRSFQYLQL